MLVFHTIDIQEIRPVIILLFTGEFNIQMLRVKKLSNMRFALRGGRDVEGDLI